MPVTFGTMTVALAALAGIPPFAGFFSKEAVLGAAEETALHHGPVAAWAGWLVLVAGLLTARGHRRVRHPALAAGLPRPGRAPEPRPTTAAPAMRWPLVVLAVPAVALGVIGLRPGWLADWSGLAGRRPGARVP